MNIQSIRQKILDGNISDDEIRDLFERGKKTPAKRGNFLSNLVRGVRDNYTMPNLYRLLATAILVLTLILCVFMLSYKGQIDPVVSAVLLAFILGFLLGKIK